MREKLIKILRKNITSVVVSVLVGFLVGSIVLMVAGYNPIQAYGIMVRGVVGKPKYIAQVIINAIPIILTALSVSFAAKIGMFNIGAEGQYVLGAMVGGLMGYFIKLPPVIHPFAILICAFIVGGLYGMLAGWLKTKFGIHEVISTIMLNWIALYFNNFITNLPQVKREGTQASHPILDSARIVVLGSWKKTDAGKEFLKGGGFWADFLKTHFHWGILIAVVAAIFVKIFLDKTTKGYEMRSVGFNQNAAKFAGINVNRNMLLAMFIAGGIAALAGATQITGTGFKINILPDQEGYGWDGLSVALLANNNPFACIIAGILFSALKYGGVSIQSEIGAPSEIINVMIGVIVFFIALSSIYPMLADRLSFKCKKEEELDA